MLRKIKFRVWDILNKKMLNWGDIFDLPAWEIFPGTPEQRAFEVMQYTGLKDKGGVEVYEGDILKLFYGKENTPLTTTKVFFNEEGYWDSKNLSKQHPFRTCYSGFNKCKVIGNIYENPELLKSLKEGE